MIITVIAIAILLIIIVVVIKMRKSVLRPRELREASLFFYVLSHFHFWDFTFTFLIIKMRKSVLCPSSAEGGHPKWASESNTGFCYPHKIEKT